MRELLALQFLEVGAEVAIEFGMLVRVFAVAEAKLQWKIQPESGECFLFAIEKSSDGAVVGGRDREGLDGEPFA